MQEFSPISLLSSFPLLFQAVVLKGCDISFNLAELSGEEVTSPQSKKELKRPCSSNHFQIKPP